MPKIHKACICAEDFLANQCDPSLVLPRLLPVALGTPGTCVLDQSDCCASPVPIRTPERSVRLGRQVPFRNHTCLSSQSGCILANTHFRLPNPTLAKVTS